MKQIINHLKKAYEKNCHEEQVKYFKQLGLYFSYAEKPIYSIACYNFALGICRNGKKISEVIAASYISKIETSINKVMTDFIKSCVVNFDKNFNDDYFTNLAAKHRKELSDIRQFATEVLGEEKFSARKIYETLSERIKELVRELIKVSMSVLPKDFKTSYAIVCLGSLARNEATPYSDLEFAVLVNSKDPQVVGYFRNVTKLLFMLILNLGETTPRIVNIEGLEWISDEESPTPKGFSFDGQMEGGCKTPIGNLHLNLNRSLQYELICTPLELAKLHDEENYAKDRHLSTVLSAIALLEGDADIITSYNTELNKIMTNVLRKKRAISLLSETSAKFEPRMGRFQKTGHEIDTKYHLYRFPHMVINQLALYYGVNCNNTFEQIDMLLKEGIFSEKNKRILEEIIAKILRFRLKNYIDNAGRQFPLIVGKTISEEKLIEFYHVLMPVRTTLEKFIKNPQSFVFKAILLFDNSNRTTGLIYEKLLNYDETESYLIVSYKHDNNIRALFDIVQLWMQKGENKKAHDFIIEAIRGNLLLLNQPEILLYLAIAKNRLKENDESNFLGEILPLWISVYEGLHKEKISFLKSLGTLYSELGNCDKALVCNFKAMELARKYCEPEDSLRVSVLSDFALACKESLFPESKELFEELLGLDLKQGDNHPNYARTLSNLGTVHLDVLCDTETAIKNFETALKIIEKYPGESALAETVCHNLRDCYINLGDWGKYNLYVSKRKQAIQQGKVDSAIRTEMTTQEGFLRQRYDEATIRSIPKMNSVNAMDFETFKVRAALAPFKRQTISNFLKNISVNEYVANFLNAEDIFTLNSRLENLILEKMAQYQKNENYVMVGIANVMLTTCKYKRKTNFSADQEVKPIKHVKLENDYFLDQKVLLEDTSIRNLEGVNENFLPRFKAGFLETKRPKKSISTLEKEYGLKDTSQHSDELEKGLRKAALNNKLEDFDIFVQHKININAKNGSAGDSALHIAARKGYIEFVRKLLENGADISNKNNEGKTPLECASDLNIVKLLKNKRRIAMS